MTTTKVTCDICGNPANMKLGGYWDDTDEAAEVDNKMFTPRLEVDDICWECHTNINAMIYRYYKKNRGKKDGR